MKLRFFKTLALSATLFSVLNAEDSTPKDIRKNDTIIVTANRSEMAERAVSQSYTIIERDEIIKSQARNIVDIIQRVPGINIAENGPHGTASIYIRGNSSYHTKVLINGADVADPASTQVQANGILNSLSLDNVERIEIIRGAQSTLYGSDAIGGVINIITRQSTETITGNISQEFGSEQYHKTSGSVLGTVKGFDYSLNLSYEGEDGISTKDNNTEADAFRNTYFNSLLGYTFNENLRFQLSGTYSDSDNEFDDGDTNTKLTIIRPELILTDLIDGRLDTSLAFSYSETKRFNNSGSSTPFKGQNEALELNNKLFINDRYSIIFGFDHSKDRTLDRLDSSVTQTTENAYYLQNLLNYEDKYFLEFGGRYIDNSEFGSHITWQVATSANFDETGTRIHASWAKGFRTPSHNELFSVYDFGFGPTFLGNPNLQPEESNSFDIGFEQTVLEDKLTFGSTAFYNDFKNEIVYIGFMDNGYQNLPGSTYIGLENFITYQVTEDIFTKLSYTRLSSDVDNNVGNNDAARRPNDTLSFLIDWQATDKLNIGSDVLYYGKRRNSGGDNVNLDAFWTANFKARYEINDNFEVFGRIDNLFDEDYEYAYDDYNSTSFNTPERSFYAGATYKF